MQLISKMGGGMKKRDAAHGQRQKMRLVSTVVFVMLMLTIVGINSSFASSLLFDRGLPTAILNGSTVANRSNVAWAFTNANWGVGDDFTINGSGPYRVDTLRTWIVGDIVGQPNAYANTTFTLWGGASDLTTSLSTSGVLQQVTYANGSNYQYAGDDFNIYKLEFTGLNWLVDGGSTYNFGVSGKDANGNYQQVFMHSSNAALGGSQADGADGWLIEFSADGTYGGYPEPFYYHNSELEGWGFGPSDVNVQIEGAPVPEPSTMLLLTTGLFGVAALRKRVRK